MTLDAALAEIVDTLHSEKLNRVSNPSSWSSESKDELFKEVNEISEATAREAVDLVKELAEKEHEGQSVLYWHFRLYSIQNILQLLQELRNQYDGLTEAELETFPFEGEWIQKNIRKQLKEAKEVAEVLAREEFFRQDSEEL